MLPFRFDAIKQGVVIQQKARRQPQRQWKIVEETLSSCDLQGLELDLLHLQSI